MSKDASGAVEFVWTMIRAADSPLLEAELAEALRYQLAPKPPSARERRLRDLAQLRQLIDAADGRFPNRDVYDGARGEAVSSHTLVERYGSWWEACSIAARMEADGKLPRGRTFSGGRLTRGRAAPKTYTVEEAIGAYRLCAFSLGRRPTSKDYYDWSEGQRRRRDRRGEPRRAPSKMALARLFPGPRRWQRINAAGAITDRELQQARAALLDVRGSDPAEPFLALPLSEAARLAAELGGSLDWLAGRTAQQHPVADAKLAFSPRRFRELRERSDVPPERLWQAAGLLTGQARTLMNGTFEPTLGMVVALASVLGVAATALCEWSSP